MGLLRRVAPAVFVGTAAVLVASNASSGVPVLAEGTTTGTDPDLGTMTSEDSGTSPRELIDRLWGDDDYDEDEDEDDHDDDHDDDDDDHGSRSRSAPAPVTRAPSTTPNTTSGSTGQCDANEVTGPTVRTEWGPVQVAAKVQNGQVCAVRVLRYPDGDRKSISINARALPALEKQVLAAGDATFDGVSGATVTSEGYRDSLQAILDQAG